ncbi:hypothetical protein C5B96_16735, partial [Subtercola sp. Z020]|uniref:glycosyltransferase n=1 Tax=Subtercola sp. Z020 TaxID=2080582 RepID=UPI000CE76765
MSQPGLSAPEPLRIAAVPGGHPYVQNIVDPAPVDPADRVVVLPDPQPVGAPRGQWWPPAMIDPAWIAANADSFDLMHIHFGTESFPLAHLEATLAALEAAGKPLVFTLHDLTNPQLADQAAHRAQLDLLVRSADEVVTLTPGAAAVVRERWGRGAVVIAHPRLAGGAAAGAGADAGAGAAGVGAGGGSAPSMQAPDAAADAATAPIVVGVHLRDLRPNIDARAAVDTVLAAVETLRQTSLDLRVVIDLNDRVRDEPTRDALRSRLAEVPFAVLREHPRFTDAELERSLLGTDISVMPYGHGTHSGWLELCWDLGVGVAAPDVGFYGEQHPVRGEVATFRRGSADSLARALLELVEGLDASAATRVERRAALRRDRAVWRREQQQGIHLDHLRLYRRALAGGAGSAAVPAATTSATAAAAA